MQAFVRCASRRWLELSVVVLLLVSAFTADPLKAQGKSRAGQATGAEAKVPGVAATLIPHNAALTVEGGGKLRAYEGGPTWTLVEVFRQRRMMHPRAAPGGSLI